MLAKLGWKKGVQYCCNPIGKNKMGRRVKGDGTGYYGAAGLQTGGDGFGDNFTLVAAENCYITKFFPAEGDAWLSRRQKKTISPGGRPPLKANSTKILGKVRLPPGSRVEGSARGIQGERKRVRAKGKTIRPEI